MAKTAKRSTKLKGPSGVAMQRRVSALARKLWAMAYKAACESAPERYWGATTEAHEFSQPGRQAAWEAVARYVLKVR